MRLVFRTDASNRIGSGHVMRCLTLAEEARGRGMDVLFICKALEGHLEATIRAAGFDVAMLPAPDGSAPSLSQAPHRDWLEGDDAADAAATRAILETLDAPPVLMIDHYALDAAWEARVRPAVARLGVIDDLADRAHACDVLVDYNPYHDAAQRYAGRVPAHCRQLLGAEYVLLRPQFRQLQPPMRTQFRHAFVFFGGVDPFDDTRKALAMLQPYGVTADVVMGSQSPFRAAVKQQCAALGYAYHEHVTDMAKLMLRADLAIGAGGTTTWERIACGLPAIAVPIAHNQVQLVRDSAREGWLIHCERMEEVPEALARVAAEPEMLRAMSQACLGRMGTQGPARILNQLMLTFRPLAEADRDRIRDWRNQENVRRYFHSSAVIGAEAHAAWFANRPANAHYRVAEYGGKPVGLVYFTRIEGANAQWGFYLGERQVAPKLGLDMAQAALQEARALGLQRLEAEVLEANRKSIELHAALGFKKQAEREGVWHYERVLSHG